jgi:hypothetical protein
MKISRKFAAYIRTALKEVAELVARPCIEAE